MATLNTDQFADPFASNSFSRNGDYILPIAIEGTDLQDDELAIVAIFSRNGRTQDFGIIANLANVSATSIIGSFKLNRASMARAPIGDYVRMAYSIYAKFSDAEYLLAHGTCTFVHQLAPAQVMISPTDPPPIGDIARLQYENGFTDASLTLGGVLIVEHKLGSMPSGIIVTDATGEQIMPDSVSNSDANTVLIGLSSYRPLIGTYNVSIVI